MCGMDSFYIEMARHSELGDLIALHQKGTAEATAEAVMKALKCPPRIADLFLPILISYCSTLDRHRVRQIEAESDKADRARAGGSLPIPRSNARHQLLSETFALGNGRRVVWGDATEADHQERMVMLAKLRSGLDKDIARHQKAIDDIRAAGVTCLNEVPEAA
jgi:hypothetical protein